MSGRERNRKPLTDPEVRKLTAEGEHAVGGVPGLVLRVRGGSRSFRLRFRNSAGVMRNMNLGAYPTETSLAKAREKAATYRTAVRDGRDPVAEIEAEREAMRMSDLLGVDEGEDRKTGTYSGWFLSVYCQTAGKLSTAKSKEAIETDRYRISKHLRSRKAFMRKTVAEVTPADLDKIKAGLSPGSWRKLRAILRIAFAHAIDLGVITSNPCDKVKAIADRKVERFLTPAERAALNAALDAAADAGPRVEGGLSESLVRLFRLLGLTGMRLGEGLSLEWSHVDWQHSALVLPTSKTGRKSVPLTGQAVAFLRHEHEKASGGLDVGKPAGLVCPDGNGRRLASNNVQRAWRMLRRNAGVRLLATEEEREAVNAGKRPAPLDDLRLHDLRHSWASDAVSAGVPLYVVGAVLGHKQPSTTARYSHLHDEAIRNGLALAGAAIEAASGTGNVAELPRRKAAKKKPAKRKAATK